MTRLQMRHCQRENHVLIDKMLKVWMDVEPIH